MEKATQCHSDLKQNGYFKTFFKLDSYISDWVLQQKWDEIDQYFKSQTAPSGELFNYLRKFQKFCEMEFIISVRDSSNDWEEDGIWHDDGSRVLAFSLSLKSGEDVSGGNLLFRKKGAENHSEIAPFNFGEMIVFRTGVLGYEHKIERVTAGRRIVVAGWCS